MSFYLNYLTNTNDFVLEQSDKNFIESIGNSSGTLSGFARAIYYDLTGIRIIKNYDYTEHNVANRSSIAHADLVAQELKVFPNPNTTDILNLSYRTSGLSEETMSYRIYDITGKSVLLGNLPASTTSLDILSLTFFVV